MHIRTFVQQYFNIIILVVTASLLSLKIYIIPETFSCYISTLSELINALHSQILWFSFNKAFTPLERQNYYIKDSYLLLNNALMFLRPASCLKPDFIVQLEDVENMFFNNVSNSNLDKVLSSISDVKNLSYGRAVGFLTPNLTNLNNSGGKLLHNASDVISVGSDNAPGFFIQDLSNIKGRVGTNIDKPFDLSSSVSLSNISLDRLHHRLDYKILPDTFKSVKNNVLVPYNSNIISEFK